ncbi:MAG: LytTR family DNA-binding domain-containing protein [Lachnospiraceae bacterium]|nr:LytTR family DNA-binding domain-containing protein [Lachnospiraceae bacterium]MDE6183828.1 LytTR family DNA-binding domain-containing protein [Lachnospiraceae bacterium]MDE7286363.1 LytTR family DNA-binding domain-containing protein [Lachnospiraceae bacterium]
MYKIAICEDDRNYIAFLKKMLLKIEGMNESTVSFYDFFSGEELLFYASLDFDLVILDIQMGDLNGYETARKLREIDRNMLLVFCTGKVEPAAEHFKVTPYRYLLKRYSDDEMLKEMAEIVGKMKEQKSYPYIMCKYSVGRDRIRVYPESVLYIAIRYGNSEVFACGKLKEHFPNEILRTGMSLNAVYEIFNESCGFIRAHNSYIINMAYIVETGAQSVKLTDGTTLTIARSRSREFQRAFAGFMAAKYKR